MILQKKIKSLFFAGILLVSLFPLSNLNGVEGLVEVRAAYFRPTDSRFRDIYSNAGLYSIESSIQAWKGFFSWASVGFLYTDGESVGMRNYTRLYQIPVGVGMKYIVQWDSVQPYFGAGAVFAYTNIHNDSPFVVCNQSKWASGGILKSGFLYHASKYIVIDIFADYTFLKVNFDYSSSNKVVNRRADLSGLSVGVGVGYKF